MNKFDALNRYFGFSQFHPLQERVIDQVLARKDALVLMPTGGGKSLCYQIPALCQEGLTLVISPLVALMKDQVEGLRANGVPAAYLNSTQTPEEARAVHLAREAGDIKLLYVSPERLFSSGNPLSLASWNIALVAVDEAHCISAWGHDFRPEYTKLGQLRQILPGVPLLALTATADPAIRRDILSQLQIPEDGVFLSSFDRPNLHLRVRPAQKRLEQILDFLRTQNGESGIIYCLSRNGCEDLALKLRQKGYKAQAYHAGMTTPDRSRVQEAFRRDEVPIICATVAFGMGIDKSNVRWVIHYNLPKNLEGFYQEIGRSGRDGLEAKTLLFYSYADVAQHLKMLEDAPPERKELLEAKLHRMKSYAEAQICRRKILLSYFGETLDQDCGNCDVCENPPQGFDGTQVAQKILSVVVRTSGAVTLRTAALILRGSQAQEVLDRGWDQIKTFGVGRDLKFEQWMEYGTQLISAGYLSVAYDQGMTLQLTSLSGPVLKGERPVTLVEFVPQAAQVQLKVPKAPPAGGLGANPELFETLKTLRLKLAQEHQVPAFVIFNDKTLRDMAEKAPSTLEEMRQVHGVGAVKLEGYGRMFLKAIQDWTLQRAR